MKLERLPRTPSYMANIRYLAMLGTYETTRLGSPSKWNAAVGRPTSTCMKPGWDAELDRVVLAP